MLVFCGETVHTSQVVSQTTHLKPETVKGTEPRPAGVDNCMEPVTGLQMCGDTAGIPAQV